MSDLIRLQKLWDAKLITTFFTKPHYNIHRTAKFFRKEHNISDTEFEQLKRTPKIFTDQREFYVNNKDVYSFIAQHLKPLYDIIEPRDLTDLFDILAWLRNADIVTKPYIIEREVRNAVTMSCRNTAQNNINRRIHAALFGKGAKIHQAFFKSK